MCIRDRNIFDQRTGEFRLLRGPVFTHILLADEINRAVPRTQSALLEAMEEQHVTIDGETLPLPAPFFVLATQNPVESESTFRLPAAQMDRFLMRLSMGYPDAADEAQMLRNLGAVSYTHLWRSAPRRRRWRSGRRNAPGNYSSQPA